MEAAAHGHSTLGIPKSVGKEFVGDSAHPAAAGIVFVAPDGDVLVLRRASTEENYAGHWSLPGGKANADETAADAAVREACEELGLDAVGAAQIKGNKHSPGLKLLDCIDTPNGMCFSTYAKAVDEKFTPKLNAEHSGYAWVGLDTLPTPIHPAVKRVLGEHIGVTGDMKPEDWDGLRSGFAKWTREEGREPAHQAADSMALDRDTVRTYDKDGRLHVARVRLTKANICPYRGEEIPGWEELGLDPQRVYQLFRAPEEIERGAKTSNNNPLLEDHEPVSAKAPKREIVVGSTGTDAEWDGTYLWNSLVVWDGEAIKGVESDEKKELSSGYYYKPVMTPGTFMGMPYDGVMTEIVFNHIATVSKGRAGADVVIGDSAMRPIWDLSRFGSAYRFECFEGA